MASMVTRAIMSLSPPSGLSQPTRRQNSRQGGFRERAEYIFNIGVFADHFILRRAETPPGGAKDDNGGTYAAEAERLTLDGLPYTEPAPA